MTSPSISVIIPTYNMSDYLQGLWSTLESSKITETASEIVIVNDGSVDRTSEKIQELQQDPRCKKLKLLTLKKNSGRFLARLAGANFASGETLLFLDTRVTPNSKFGHALPQVAHEHPIVIGGVQIDLTASVFSLYWKRTHEWIFRRYFRDIKAGFFLNRSNFNQYPKGTTVFLCKKSIFLKICESFRGKVPLNDDLSLIDRIVDQQPIWIDSRLTVSFIPRQTWKEFLLRIWERGPSFAEFHLLNRRGSYFILFLIWHLGYGLAAFMLFFNFGVGLAMIAIANLLLLLSTVVFSKSPREFWKMSILHITTIHVYAFGALWGLLVNAKLISPSKAVGASKVEDSTP